MDNIVDIKNSNLEKPKLLIFLEIIFFKIYDYIQIFCTKIKPKLRKMLEFFTCGCNLLK